MTRPPEGADGRWDEAELAAYRAGVADERAACAQLAEERGAVCIADVTGALQRLPFADLIRARGVS